MIITASVIMSSCHHLFLQMVMMETVISGITDLYPNVLRRKKALFTFVMCMLLFVLGIPMTTKVSIYNNSTEAHFY